MAVVDTLQALREVADGARIEIEGSTPRGWVKSGVHLVSGDMTVPLEQFEGQCLAGTVSTVGRLAPGDLFRSRDGRYYYYIAVIDDNRMPVGLATWDTGNNGFHCGRYSESVNLGDSQLVAEGDRPEWFPLLKQAGDNHYLAEANYRSEQSSEAARLQSHVTTLETEVATRVRERDNIQASLTSLRSALESYAEDHEVEAGTPLGDLYDEFGLNRFDTEEIEVTVTVTGSTAIDFEEVQGGMAEIEILIQPDRLADWKDRSETQTTLTWSANAEIPLTVTRGECGCSLVGPATVENWLDAHDFAYSSFDYEIKECENC